MRRSYDQVPSPWQLEDGNEPKIHSKPSRLPSTGLTSSVKNTWQHLKNGQVSVVSCVLLCTLCLWTGSQVAQQNSLPTPEPGLRKQASVGVARALLSESGSFQQSSKHIDSDQDIKQFQQIALHQSGFSNVRPAVTPGQSGEDVMRAVPFQVISWYPRITYYPGFLDQQTTEHIIKLATKYLQRSELALRPGEQDDANQQVRTSMGCFLSSQMDPDGVLAAVEAKIAAVTHLPVENGEAFNVLRYGIGQHYDSHYDSFNPDEYGKQPSQRIATLLTFLKAPEEGGETIFKREGYGNGNLTIKDWRTCADGLGIKVKPKAGDAVLFWSTTSGLTLDPHSLHGACAVVKGEKWSMAKWIREKPSGFHNNNQGAKPQTAIL